jgi:hypothetical protein
MRAFPDDAGPSPRGTHAILHRLDQDRGDRLVLLVQSRTKPMIDRWPAGYVLDMGGDLDLAFLNVGENPAVRSLEAQKAALSPGRRFAFRLRANTTKKVDTKTGPDGVRLGFRRLRGQLRRLVDAAFLEFLAAAAGARVVAPNPGRSASWLAREERSLDVGEILRLVRLDADDHDDLVLVAEFEYASRALFGLHSYDGGFRSRSDACHPVLPARIRTCLPLLFAACALFGKRPSVPA